MAGEPELGSGISSQWVQHLQEPLQYHGHWSGALDGDFGPELEGVVQAYQQAVGLICVPPRYACALSAKLEASSINGWRRIYVRESDAVGDVALE